MPLSVLRRLLGPAIIAALVLAVSQALGIVAAVALSHTPPPAKRATQPTGGTLEPNTLEHFCAWAARLTLPKTGGDPRRNFIIEPFQRRILADYFNGISETFVLLPKGNGKSMLMAALALYHLIYTDEAEAYIFASSAKQANRLLKMAAGFVRRSPGLRKRLDLKLGYMEIRSRRDGGTLQVLAADPDTADGIAPTLVLCDELHRWKTLEVYTLAKEGLHKRRGQVVGISTAGEDEATPFGRLRHSALKHLTETDERGVFKYAMAPSGEFVWIEWSLEPSADTTDMELVKLANPLSQITAQTLRTRYDSPATRAAWWARFVCNIWTRDDDAAVSAMEWAPNIVSGCEIPEGAQGVLIGADFGWRKDCTALVPVWGMGQEPLVMRVDRRVKIIEAPGDGTMTRKEKVWAVLEEFAELWPEAKVVLDPNASGETLAQEIEAKLDLEVIIQPQDPAPMAHAAGIVMEAIRDRRLDHPGDLSFSSHVLAAYLKSVGGSEKQRFVKGDGGAHIDAVIALAMAARQLAVADMDTDKLIPFVM